MEKEKLVALVQAVQKGESNGAARLYEAFHEDIYYYIFKTVNDSELAADLTQDTFIEILQTISNLQEPAAFVTWSRQIAYHRCTAHFRKRRELLADEEEDGYSVFDTIEEDRTEFIPGAALDQEDLKKAIHQMIDRLPAEQRSAILMRYFEELPIDQIAKIQGVSEGTVKSRLNYGRKAIGQAVEDYEKKNGVKLHCAGMVPLLLWLFAQGRSGAAAATATAASTAATAGATTVTTATATATGSIAVKLVAGAAALTLAAGVVGFGFRAAKNPGPTTTTLPTAMQMSTTAATRAPTQPSTTIATQPPTQPNPMLDIWCGYGMDTTKLHTLRFEMRVDLLSPDQIRGHLEVTNLYQLRHASAFAGQGNTVDGKIHYHITFEVPAYIGTIPAYEHYQMILVYDPATREMAFLEDYLVVMARQLQQPPITVLAEDARWCGEGENVLCWPNEEGHSFEVFVQIMTEDYIQGTLTVYKDGQLEHTSPFTGRGFTGKGRTDYEVILAVPHKVDDMWGSTEEIFWLYYHHAEDALSVYSYYEFTLLREENSEG